MPVLFYVARRVRAGARSNLFLLVPALMLSTLLAACGEEERTGSQIAWQVGTPMAAPTAEGDAPEVAEAAPTTTDTAEVIPTEPTESPADPPTVPPPPTEQLEAEPTSAPDSTTVAEDHGQDSASADDAPSARLTPEELAEYQPNELGAIPILQYHLFTTDPAQENEMTRSIESFRADLQWLYDRNFYVIPLRDLVTNQISAPPGKHPVVLTFDDSTSGQFRFLPQDDGTLLVDPNSAVGVMEEFYAENPEFGRGGHFAVLPYNCFYVPDEDQVPYCEQKLRWLIENGYEIGNHTYGHANLFDVDDETFKREIAEAMLWVRERIPEGSAEDIFTVPFGMYPDRETKQHQRAWMRDGFEYEGEQFKLIGSLMVGAEPAFSPNTTAWDPLWIARIQAYDEELDRWLPRFESGEVILYTSDGNPDTVAIPADMPAALEGMFEPAAAEANGKEVIEY